jgi:hypothetical protein
VKGNEYKDGLLNYEVSKIRIPSQFAELKKDLLSVQWQGGYVAFSASEENLDVNKIGELLAKIGKRFAGKGYVMELCAWASISDAHEEISLERDDDGLLFQHWKLNKNEGFECYYRDTAVEIRRKSILRSQKLKAVEVICPDRRLHFFLTSEIETHETK